MGKHHHHRKVLKSEKAKTKLKASAKTKFLPKGGNVTNVNFKIKPIVVLEQLKTATLKDGPVTRKNLSFKDLLSRLNHHNTTAKLEACEGLIELIKTAAEDVLQYHLCSVLNESCKLFLDLEGKVRTKAVYLIECIIQKVPPKKLTPFHDALTSYASCAMTHINKNIQSSSLLIIDVYMKYIPELVVHSFDKIFNNFVTLISKLRNDSNICRTLTVNLNSNITTVKWRIQVLTRLHYILRAVVNSKEEESLDENYRVVNFNIGIVPLYKGVEYQPIDLVATDRKQTGKIENYILVLVPLLHETWTEVCPSDESNTNGVTVILHDSAAVLSCVVGIFHQLWLLLKKSKEKPTGNEMSRIFLAQSGQRFVYHILNQFPYRQNEIAKSKLKDLKHLEINVDPKCVHENLLICYMFAALYRTFPSSFYVGRAHDVVIYLRMCLTNRNYVFGANVALMISSLRLIFFENSKPWMSKSVKIESLLDGTIHFYKHSHGNIDKMKAFELLCELAQLPHLRLPNYELWMSDLPALLCEKDIPMSVVDTLSFMSRQNNKLFLSSFLTKLPAILDNLPFINIVGNSIYPYQVRIVSMMSYLPLRKQHLLLLQKHSEASKETELGRYLQEMLKRKVTGY